MPSHHPPDAPIRPVPDQFTRDGFAFTRLWRCGSVAIYEQRHPGATEPDAWEVVVLRVSAAHPNDTDQSPKERYPSNEDWGKRGWTYLELHQAEQKALWLVERENAR